MEYTEMMKEYRSLARYITQMATAALILPVIFIRDIMGIDDKPRMEHLRVVLSQLRFKRNIKGGIPFFGAGSLFAEA